MTPVEPCKYRPDKNLNPRLMQADCTGEWIVIQDNFHYCPFCGKPIERFTPPRIVS